MWLRLRGEVQGLVLWSLALHPPATASLRLDELMVSYYFTKLSQYHKNL